MKVLLVDDDVSIHDLVKKVINPLISLVCRTDLPAFPQELEEYDLVILDLLLENANSLDFIKALGENNAFLLERIILLTGSANPDHELETHQLGVRDFVKKPFHPKVLAAVIDKHLSHLKHATGAKYGPFLLDKADYTIFLMSPTKVKLELTKTEYGLLKALIESKGRVVTREKLMTDLWDMSDETQTRTVDMHVSTLRKKIHPFGDLLVTKRGIGYFLKDSL